jgi:sulfur carrier protein ThiS
VNALVTLSPAQIVYVPNPLMPQLGSQVIDVRPGSTVTDAIAEHGLKLRYSTVLYRDDVMVKRSEWDTLPIRHGEIVSLVTLPQGGDDTGSQILAIVAMIALAVVAPGLGQAAASAWFSGSEIAASAIAATIVVAGSLLISAMLPKPKGYDPGGSPSPTYSINAQQNRARLGEPIPELLGQHIIYPDLAAAPYAEFESGGGGGFVPTSTVARHVGLLGSISSAGARSGTVSAPAAADKQIINELFCLGIGDYDIHQIRVADTVVWEDGVYTDAYPELTIEIVTPGGQVTLFPDNVVTSTEVNNAMLLGTNEPSYGYIGPFAASASGTEAAQIAVDIALPAGLFTTDSKGKVANATVSFLFEAQPIDASGTPTGAWFTLANPSYTMATRDAIRRSIVSDVTPGRYQVRAKRTNAKSTDGKTGDILIWVAMRAYLPSQQLYDGVTMIAIRAEATNHLNGTSAQQFNVICTRKLPLYDPDANSWSANTATRSIAAAASYVLSNVNGGNLADSRVDLATLWGSLDATWTTRGDHFDGIFDSRKSFWEALQSILRAGRTEPLLAGPNITFARDEEKTAYRTAFSPRNMIAGSFEIDYVAFDANSADAVIVEFIDNRVWRPNEIFCALPDSIVDPNDPTVPRLQWFGITGRAQAWREGIHLVAQNRYRRKFPSFRTEMDGRLCFKGDLVKVSHWMPTWGASMEVLDCADDAGGDILTLSEPWTVPAGHALDTKLILLTTPDGLPYGPVEFTLLSDGMASDARQASVQLITTADPGGRYAGEEPHQWGLWSGSGLQKERPQAVLGVASIMARDCLVISMRPDSGQTTQLACVLEDDRVHSADVSGPPSETDPPTGFPDANLTIDGLIIQRVPRDGGGEYILVTVNGATDAESFSAHWKWGTATDFGNDANGLGRTFVLNSEATALAIEVRARGHSGFGDWFAGTVAAGAGASRPPQSVDSLADVTFVYEGLVVYLTTDDKFYRYNGTAWIATINATDLTGQIVTSQITDHAVTTVKIADGAVTGLKLAAGLPFVYPVASRAAYAATYGAPTAGSLLVLTANDAPFVANQLLRFDGTNWTAAARTVDLVGTVTVAQLSAAYQGAALNSDPAPIDTSAWVTGAPPGIYRIGGLGSIGKVGSQGIITDLNSAGYQYFNSQPTQVPVDPAKAYRVHAWYYSTGSADGTNSVMVALFDNTGTQILTAGDYWWYPLNRQAASVSMNTWTELTANFGAGTSQALPSNAAFMMIGVNLNAGGTVGQVYAQDLRLEEVFPSTLIKDGAITTTKVADNSISTPKLQALSVTTNELAAGSVSTAKLQANSVTTGELAANAVTTAKLAAGSVTTNELSANAVTTAKLATNSVTTNELAANAVTAGKIDTNAVTAGTMDVGAVNASAIIVNDIIVTGHIQAENVTKVRSSSTNPGTFAPSASAFTSSGMPSITESYSGAPVLISVSLDFDNTDSAEHLFGVKITCDGSPVYNQSAKFICPKTPNHFPFSVQIIDTPSNASHTYAVSFNGDSTNIRANTSTISTVECKV